MYKSTRAHLDLLLFTFSSSLLHSHDDHHQVKLTFGAEEGSIDILEMVSGENEHVSLGKNLKARGNVEDWMTLVEQRMKSELTLALKEGLLDYDTKVMTSFRY